MNHRTSFFDFLFCFGLWACGLYSTLELYQLIFSASWKGGTASVKISGFEDIFESLLFTPSGMSFRIEGGGVAQFVDILRYVARKSTIGPFQCWNVKNSIVLILLTKLQILLSLYKNVNF